MTSLQWSNWQDVPFEEYIHNEHAEVPGVVVRHKRIEGWFHHIKSFGNEPDTMTHLMVACKSFGEDNYVITPARKCHLVLLKEHISPPEWCMKETDEHDYNPSSDCTCCSQCCTCGG